ncbi:MAG: hypothetical protein AAF696_26275 [Bacteroidota bacterium]
MLLKHSELREKDIELEYLPESKAAYVTSSGVAISHRVMEWLRSKDEGPKTDAIDAVYFQDTLGLGYYPLLARHQGLAFQKMKMVKN